MNMAHWESLTWPEIVAARDAVVIIPTGSVEQHGPHLPIGTDTLIAEGITRLLQESTARHLVVAPSLRYTYAKLNSAYPGTINLSGSTLTNMASDILNELFRQGFSRVMFVNGHLESIPFIMEGAEISLASRENGDRGGQAQPKVVIANWWEYISDEFIDEVFGDRWPGWEAEHAALTETSLMLHLWPDLVRETDTSPRDYQRFPYRILPWPEKARPASGVYADPRGATPEIGRRLAEIVVAGLDGTIQAEF